MTINKNDIYLPDNPSVSDMNLSLEAIDGLNENIMQHVAIESISSDPLYMAMGYIAAEYSCGYLPEWKRVFSEFLSNMQTSVLQLADVDMANYILKKYKVYLDGNDEDYDRPFVFKQYESVLSSIDYTRSCAHKPLIYGKLNLLNISSDIYIIREEWKFDNHNLEKIYVGCDQTQFDKDNKNVLCEYLINYCVNTTELGPFRHFCEKVDLDPHQVGMLGLYRWLSADIKADLFDRVSQFELDDNWHDNLLIFTCLLLELDLTVVKKHIDIIKNLNVLNLYNLFEYSQLIYNLSKNPSFNKESTPVDFDFLT